MTNNNQESIGAGWIVLIAFLIIMAVAIAVYAFSVYIRSRPNFRGKLFGKNVSIGGNARGVIQGDLRALNKYGEIASQGVDEGYDYMGKKASEVGGNIKSWIGGHSKVGQYARNGGRS